MFLEGASVSIGIRNFSTVLHQQPFLNLAIFLVLQSLIHASNRSQSQVPCFHNSVCLVKSMCKRKGWWLTGSFAPSHPRLNPGVGYYWEALGIIHFPTYSGSSQNLATCSCRTEGPISTSVTRGQSHSFVCHPFPTSLKPTSAD